MGTGVGSYSCLHNPLLVLKRRLKGTTIVMTLTLGFSCLKMAVSISLAEVSLTPFQLLPQMTTYLLLNS